MGNRVIEIYCILFAINTRDSDREWYYQGI